MKSSASISRLVIATGIAILGTFAAFVVHAASLPPRAAPRQDASKALQAAVPASNPRFAQTDVVLVDATVRDRAGQPVTGLRPAEFQLLEDGVPQTLQNFTFVSAGEGSFYLIAYRSTNQSTAAAYRSIQVRLIDRPGVAVMNRAGYYAGDGGFFQGAYPEDTPGLASPVVTERRTAEYTTEAIRAKIQGEVGIEAVVDVDGHVSRARVTQSLDHVFGLDNAALAAARQWTFTPGELKGEKVPVAVRLTLAFRLH